MSGRSIVKTSLLLLPVHIVLRGGEALLPVFIARWFGRTAATDVYNLSAAVFTFAGSLVFTAYQDSAIIPILTELKVRSPAEVPRVLGSLLAHTLVIGGALAALIGLTALGWFHIRYAPTEIVVARGLVLPLTVFLLVLSLRTFFGAILHAEYRFFTTPVASAIGMVANVSFVYFTKNSLDVAAIAWGALLGETAALLFLSWFALRLLAVRVIPTLSRPEAVRKFVRLIVADVGGGAVTRVNPVVDQLMAGFAGVVGGGTLLRYSGDVSSLPTSLLQAALLPVLLSHLSEQLAHGQWAEFKKTVRRAMLTVSAILLFLGAALYVAREPLLRLIFLGGKMDAAGVTRMAHVLPYHLVGLVPFGALLVLARAHIALKNTTIMFPLGVANAALNVVFNVILVRYLGLEGIALSTSGVQAAIAVAFWISLRLKLREQANDARVTASA